MSILPASSIASGIRGGYFRLQIFKSANVPARTGAAASGIEHAHCAGCDKPRRGAAVLLRVRDGYVSKPAISGGGAVQRRLKIKVPLELQGLDAAS